MPKEVIALLALAAALAGASPARAFVPPSYQATARGYAALLGRYKMVDISGQLAGMPPLDVRLEIKETTLEISFGGGILEKATYRVLDRYGDIFRLEVTSTKGGKKVEIFEILLQADMITLYEIDKDGHDKNKFRFERVP